MSRHSVYLKERHEQQRSETHIYERRIMLPVRRRGPLPFVDCTYLALMPRYRSW